MIHHPMGCTHRLARWLGALVFTSYASGALASDQTATQLPSSAAPEGGIVFVCPTQNREALAYDINSYLQSLGVMPAHYTQSVDAQSGALQFVLQDPLSGTNTLDLARSVGFELKEELVQLPRTGKTPRTVVTVSKKEILLALLQRGRTSRFSGNACTVDALKDQVGIRQNTVAWSESMELQWPNGRSARWNKKYWNRGNLQPHQALHLAVADVFMHPQRYAIGCYTATKLIVIQGTIDYFRRIKHDLATADAIEARLLQDGDALAHIEPGAAWFFEKDATSKDLAHPGKLVSLHYGVAPDNFVPGDWSYFLNTDPVTYEKTGYEGSNAIYLGRGKFDDYYNDNNHNYTYSEKLQEVYQWRHKVFSRERDVAKIHPLTAAEVVKLGRTPVQGGIELNYRMTPYQFGFSALPDMSTPVALQ